MKAKDKGQLLIIHVCTYPIILNVVYYMTTLSMIQLYITNKKERFQQLSSFFFCSNDLRSLFLFKIFTGMNMNEKNFFSNTESKKDKKGGEEKPSILQGTYIFPNGDRYGMKFV